MAFRKVPLKRNPQVLDEIQGEIAPNNPTVHIEQMSKHLYWCRIGDEIFYFATAAKQGPGIVFLDEERYRNWQKNR